MKRLLLPAIRRFGFLLPLGLMTVVALGAGQPRMHEALDALHRAKTSMHPAEDLHEALKRLEAGAHDKGGFRVEAIAVVKQAIAQVNAGHSIEANKLITEAIGKVEKGVAAGHR